MQYKLTDSVLLVTGGTGSWGYELITQLLEKYHPRQIRIYSRGEHKQLMMKKHFNDERLKFIIGDVRDKNILGFAMKGVDFVFHLAALKHVPICEDNTWEAVLTNIYGTQNVIECALENEVKRVIDISSDKAVDPFNLYGITKACGEKLIINANTNYQYFHNNSTNFICIRGGNVLGTTGSVIPLFKKQLQTHNEITITHPGMTRFLLSVREAISLVFTAVEHALGGEIFVLRMPATTVQTIAEVMIQLFGNDQSVIKNIGARPGEKMHECLVSRNEVVKTKIWNDNYFVILPQFCSSELDRHYINFPQVALPEFTSENTNSLDRAALTEMIKREKWLFDSNIDKTI